MTQTKQSLRLIYYANKIQWLKHCGGDYHSGLRNNAMKVIESTGATPGKDTTIGSYIFATDRQIIPPYLSSFQYAYPYFQPKVGNTPPLMTFKKHTPNTKYTKQIYGIKVPPKQAETVTPSIIFVPLTTFNPTYKQRIGYGGGYYDKYIQFIRQMKGNKCASVCCVGIAVQALKQQRLHFWSQFDRPLDYIITQSSIY